jgi:Protein of unknown function (DUF2752)
MSSFAILANCNFQMQLFIKKNIELIFLSIALVVLYFLPVHNEPQVSLCFFKFVGLTKCWGCGIGHSIHYALHFQIQESWNHHFMGIPACIILIYRMVQQILNNIYQTKKYEFFKPHFRP